jgi:hypothetical protein
MKKKIVLILIHIFVQEISIFTIESVCISQIKWYFFLKKKNDG